MRKTSLIVFAALLTFGNFSLGGELRCAHIPLIASTMMKQHYLYSSSKMNANLENKAIDQQVKIIDSAKLYLYESDVAEIKKLLTGFYDKLAKGNCKPLEDMHKIFIKRADERTAFAAKYLGKDFKFDEKIQINLDSEKREYPKNEAQANAFHEKYIQWQVANFLASDMKLEEAKGQIVRRYERAAKVLKDQKLEETYSNYLDAFARALDPHSNFLSRESLEDFEINMRLSLEGIGATLSAQDGYTVVEQLVPGGAAALSGLVQNQDKIISVGQGEEGELEPIIDMPLRDVVRKIRGPKGTKVKLVILRKQGENSERLSVVITRAKINLEQEAANINYIEKEVGGNKKTFAVINLPSFYSDSKRGGRSAYEDVKKLLAEAATKKVQGIVLDLASNGGGALDDAVKLAGLFFRKGNVVKTQGSQGSPEILADEDPTVNYAGPLVVLTNRLSASASEIVAGALQDYKRAVIVGGDHTFGKGSVQSVQNLPEGMGAFKVTMGMFFVPGGNSTQHRGVSADIVLPGIFSTDELGEKILDYSLPPKTIKPFLSAEANTAPEASWLPVDKNTIKSLEKNSKARVAQSADFQKVLKELKEAKTHQKIVKLSDVVKKKDEISKEEKEKKKSLDPATRSAEYMKRPDVQESLNVLADLVSLQASVPLAASPEKPSAVTSGAN